MSLLDMPFRIVVQWECIDLTNMKKNIFLQMTKLFAYHSFLFT